MQGGWLIGLVAVAAAVQVFGINKSLQTSAKRALVHSKISSYRTPQCVFVCTVTPRSIAAGASPFCLDTKRTKKVIPIAIGTAEMLLCAAGLCPQTGENLGLQLFRRATLSLQYPVCENLLCPAPFTALPVFPGFFPKLFCGREESCLPQALCNIWYFVG